MARLGILRSDRLSGIGPDRGMRLRYRHNPGSGSADRAGEASVPATGAGSRPCRSTTVIHSLRLRPDTPRRCGWPPWRYGDYADLSAIFLVQASDFFTKVGIIPRSA